MASTPSSTPPLLKPPAPPARRRRYTSIEFFSGLFIALCVLAACLSIGVVWQQHFRSEDVDARQTFTANANYLANKLSEGMNEHVQDLRNLATTVSKMVSISGAHVTYDSFHELSIGLRYSNERWWGGISYAANVSHDERPAFEAAMSAEAGFPRVLRSYLSTPVIVAPNSSWYVASLHFMKGTEAGTGETYGFAAAEYTTPLGHALFVTAAQSGTVVVTHPVASPVSVTSPGQPFIVVAAPVYCEPAAIWWAVPAATDAAAQMSMGSNTRLPANASAMIPPPPVIPAALPPLVYCRKGTACWLDRNGSSGAGNVVATTTLWPAPAVPLYAYDDESIAGGPVVAANTILETTTAVSSGFLIASLFPSTFAAGYLFGAPDVASADGYLVYVEDITSSPLDPSRDPVVGSLFVATVTAFPGLSMDAIVRASNGTTASIAHANGGPVYVASANITLAPAFNTLSVWRVVDGPALEPNAYGNCTDRVGDDDDGGGFAPECGFLFAIDLNTAVPAGSNCVANLCSPLMQRDDFLGRVGSTLQLGSCMSYVVLLSGRVWHVLVCLPSTYRVAHNTSTSIALFGSMLLIALCSIVVALSMAAWRWGTLNSMAAAMTAHELTVAIAAHELRNPGHAISSTAILLVEDAKALESWLMQRRGSSGGGKEGAHGGCDAVDDEALLRARIDALKVDAELVYSSSERLHCVINEFMSLQVSARA